MIKERVGYRLDKKVKKLIGVLSCSIFLTGCGANHKASSNNGSIKTEVSNKKLRQKSRVKGKVNNSITSTTSTNVQAASVKPKHKKHKMNFAQIKQGNYSSIAGKWKLVAFADNAYNGKGITWRKLRKIVIQNLKITKRKIFLGKHELVRGKRMTDPNDVKKFKRKLKFVVPSKANRKVMKKGTLEAYSNSAIVWDYNFYPRNISLGNPARGRLPKAVDTKKERILIYSSNMGNTWIFQRGN